MKYTYRIPEQSSSVLHSGGVLVMVKTVVVLVLVDFFLVDFLVDFFLVGFLVVFVLVALWPTLTAEDLVTGALWLNNQ